LLVLWIDNFSGHLKTSRNNGVVGGPLVRFLQATTGPVMGSKAPRPEGIHEIVDRERKRRAAQ
jgi:hypothetical protein